MSRPAAFQFLNINCGLGAEEGSIVVLCNVCSAWWLWDYLVSSPIWNCICFLFLSPDLRDPVLPKQYALDLVYILLFWASRFLWGSIWWRKKVGTKGGNGAAPFSFFILVVHINSWDECQMDKKIMLLWGCSMIMSKLNGRGKPILFIGTKDL